MLEMSKVCLLDGGENIKDKVILKQSEIGLERYVSTDKILLTKLNIIVKSVIKHKNAWQFNGLVDVEGLQMKEYFDVIENPIDFAMINA